MAKLSHDMSINERMEMQILTDKFSGRRAPFRQVS